MINVLMTYLRKTCQINSVVYRTTIAETVDSGKVETYTGVTGNTLRRCTTDISLTSDTGKIDTKHAWLTISGT